MASNIYGRLRAAVVGAFSGTDTPVSSNSRGDLAVAQSLPPMAELVRLGNTWSCAIPLANHFTTVAALPTTLAQLVLANGEAAGGKSYIIHQVWFVADTTQAAATQVTLLGQLVPNRPVPIALPTNNTAVLINSRNGSASYGGLCSRAIANTAFMVADKWEVLNSLGGFASASIGAGCYADVQGGFIVPPGAIFGINAIVGTAAATSATMGLSWSEVQLDNTIS